MSTPRPLRNCPVCGAPARPEQRPFCSPACRDRDLIAWASEAYRLPVAPGADADAGGDASVDAGDAAASESDAPLDRPPGRDL